MIFPANHFTSAKAHFKPNQSATELQHKKQTSTKRHGPKHTDRTESNEINPFTADLWSNPPFLLFDIRAFWR